MAPPKQQPSLAGQRAIKHLVVDTGALIAAPVSSLRETATNYLVTSDVVQELRDKRGRNVLEEAKLQLPADTLPQEEGGAEKDELFRENEGFQVRDPTPESVAKITAFARKTGDLAVLSSADIRVLALCLTLELEENGTWRVREFPGQVLIPPPKDEKAAASAEAGDKGKEKEVEGEGEAAGEKAPAGEEQLADGVAALNVGAEQEERKEPASEASPAPPAEEAAEAASSSLPPPVPNPAAESESPPQSSVPTPAASTSAFPAEEGATSRAGAEEEDDDEDVSDAESDSSAGSWITPDNVHAHKVRDLGLFEAPEASTSVSTDASTSTTPATAGAASTTTTKAAKTPKPKTIMKAAVLTGDYAMQNVALQMGLNVLGSGGKRVREVRTWVLRCHACFKLCKNPDKRFCPSCGGATLLRTSITYVPVSPQNPQGYILHLKSNYNYRLRGTQYSLPNPKVGRAGGVQQAAPVVREDQKEWIRGVKSAEVRRNKEERALQKALLNDEERKRLVPAGGAGSYAVSASGTAAGWFAQAGTLEAQMLGIGGGKGGIENPKGRRRGGKNGKGGEVRLDKSGLPVIGSGRRNPNEARRRK
ncbi:hypothetical protein JCM10908_002726 [Rhodotorula pacifica]|uniref:rRNA-binding endoribonuclease n=1 Tax=Rhodotorula pacifica TaxID=1495444 RepID=UPI00317B6E41